MVLHANFYDSDGHVMTTQEFLDISNEREAQRFGPNVVALRVPELEQLRKSYGACSFYRGPQWT